MNKKCVPVWAHTIRSWVSHFVSIESVFYNNLHSVPLNGHWTHTNCSFNILSLFMDGGGKSSQQKIYCLLGHRLEKLCIGNIYSKAEVNGSFIATKQTCLQQRELQCWSWNWEGVREGIGNYGKGNTGSDGVRDTSQCKGWEKDWRGFCGKLTSLLRLAHHETASLGAV